MQKGNQEENSAQRCERDGPANALPGLVAGQVSYRELPELGVRRRGTQPEAGGEAAGPIGKALQAAMIVPTAIVRLVIKSSLNGPGRRHCGEGY